MAERSAIVATACFCRAGDEPEHIHTHKDIRPPSTLPDCTIQRTRPEQSDVADTYTPAEGADPRQATDYATFLVVMGTAIGALDLGRMLWAGAGAGAGPIVSSLSTAYNTYYH